jgi:2-hydroxy-3-keto-5-methylthiopentenyl-1-phosphate phosphatase
MYTQRMLAFLDYDGTLTTRECNEIALQKYAGDAWRPIEEELKADRLSHADGFDRQIGLVQAPRAELLGTLVDAAVLLPGLRGFLEELARRGGRAVVVSAGLREAIEAVWRRDAMPPVELFASELVGEGPDGGPPYHLAFNPALGDCPRCGPRLCKGALLRELRLPGETVLVFGDGASDLCPAREADLTFARDHLAERCEAEGLAWRPLPDFTGVWAEVDAWLRDR